MAYGYTHPCCWVFFVINEIIDLWAALYLIGDLFTNQYGPNNSFDFWKFTSPMFIIAYIGSGTVLLIGIVNEAANYIGWGLLIRVMLQTVITIFVTTMVTEIQSCPKPINQCLYLGLQGSNIFVLVIFVIGSICASCVLFAYYTDLGGSSGMCDCSELCKKQKKGHGKHGHKHGAKASTSDSDIVQLESLIGAV